MSSSLAGWLQMNAINHPFSFFPLQRYQDHNLPPEIKVILGKKQTAEVKIHSSHLIPTMNHLLPVRLEKTNKGTYQMGPFVGILTSEGGSPFRGNHQNFIDLINLGKKMGVTVYVVTPRGLQYGNSVVMGYLFKKGENKENWVPTILPLPNVIYNRIPTRIAEQKAEVQSAIQLINEREIPFFNPSFFNKWTLFQYLINSPEKKYLPATLQLDQISSLQKMLQSFPSVMLKPTDGKAGNGMMKVTRQKKNYSLFYQASQHRKNLTFSSLPALWSHIRSLQQGKSYLIQQAIQLAQFEGSPYDVRMLLQKNGKGDWGVSGTGIRVAGKQAISTHVPMGGRIENIAKVLPASFPNRESEILGNLKKMGLRISKLIEEKSVGTFGEMSMDIGLDVDGNPWFFEANAKPMKFDEPEIRETSLQRIIEYSLYLSGFQGQVGKTS